VSAFTETFLLEKSRIVSVPAHERNYHVFYLLVNEHSHRLRYKDTCDDLLFLKGGVSSFAMLGNQLNDSSNLDDSLINRNNNNDGFQELERALTSVGCSPLELTYLWSVIAALLHMGNITVYESKEDINSVNSNAISVSITLSSIPIEKLVEVLGVPLELFKRSITYQQVKIGSRSSITMKQLRVIDVQNNINGLIKWMYSAIFTWLLRKINSAHSTKILNDNDNLVDLKFIGILDIFGFESLQTNSFEQLCINFTNERLQRLFLLFLHINKRNFYYLVVNLMTTFLIVSKSCIKTRD
jgi:myosin heavy subunit